MMMMMMMKPQHDKIWQMEAKAPTWKCPSPCLDHMIKALLVLAVGPAVKLQHLCQSQGLESRNFTCGRTWVPRALGLKWSTIQWFSDGLLDWDVCAWWANTRVLHGHMSTKVGSCWIRWPKRVGSLKPCSLKGRINAQRVSESNLGKGFSLHLATFKVFQGDGLQHLEVW